MRRQSDMARKESNLVFPAETFTPRYSIPTLQRRFDLIEHRIIRPGFNGFLDYPQIILGETLIIFLIHSFSLILG